MPPPPDAGAASPSQSSAALSKPSSFGGGGAAYAVMGCVALALVLALIGYRRRRARRRPGVRMAAGTATWGPSQLADDSFATVAPLQMSDISGMAAGRREGDGHGGLELSSRGGFVPFRDEAEGEGERV